MSDGQTVPSSGGSVAILPVHFSSPSPASPPFVVCFCLGLKKKIFLFSKFLLFYYLKTVVMMTMLLMTMSILLIL